MHDSHGSQVGRWRLLCLFQSVPDRLSPLFSVVRTDFPVLNIDTTCAGTRLQVSLADVFEAETRTTNWSRAFHQFTVQATAGCLECDLDPCDGRDLAIFRHLLLRRVNMLGMLARWRTSTFVSLTCHLMCKTSLMEAVELLFLA